MERSTLQKYEFRELSDGTMVGGFSIQNMLKGGDVEGASRLEGLSVPAGLYSENNNKMSGGASEDIGLNVTYGGTIDGSVFDKLYGRVAEHKIKSKRPTTQKKK